MNTITREKVHSIVREFRAEKPSSLLTDSASWQEIFVRVFGEPPVGDDDPRWDELIEKDKLAALRAAFAH